MNIRRRVSMTVTAPSGVGLSGMIFDAGAVNSPVLLQVGTRNEQQGADKGDGGTLASPTALHDIFFRIGGATPGKATTALVVNSNNAILDDIWSWRADHGNGVGWTSNTADTGLVVNGDHVTAYGLFVEHYQKYNVIWNGTGGTDVFFQNEMPYDVPSQAAWMSAPGVDGWAAFKVGSGVTSFTGSSQRLSGSGAEDGVLAPVPELPRRPDLEHTVSGRQPPSA